MRPKLCVITGTRAEYGLLRWVMQLIRDDPAFQLQIIATGMHLSPEFGLTYREIENDGFRIDRKVEMLTSSDSPVGIGKSIGLGVIGFADALADLRPDLVIVLGDRYEILAAATAATVGRIPIAHLHGGETTEGAMDESFRHAITKMAQLHFVAADEYRRRVIQLGEDPGRVHQVGGLGIDGIRRLELLDRAGLEAALGCTLLPRSLLVTFHPVTLEHATAAAQMRALLAALHDLPATSLIFTMPNSDTDGRVLIELIREFTASHPHAHAFVTLGQLRYLSCLRHVDGVVGNSSSGLLEAPSFRKGTINIGDRQRGRLRAASVIDCPPEQAPIAAALDRLFSADFQGALPAVRNPYGEGGASEKIVAILRRQTFPLNIKKAFYDLPPGSIPAEAAGEGGRA